MKRIEPRPPRDALNQAHRFHALICSSIEGKPVVIPDLGRYVIDREPRLWFRNKRIYPAAIAPTD